MPSMVRQTVRLGRALYRSVPGASETLAGLLQQLAEDQEAPPLDPLTEAGLLEGVNQQAGSAVRTASAARAGATTAALSATDILAGRMALSRGLLARESARVRGELAARERAGSTLQTLAGLTQGGFRGGPTEQLIQARTALQVAAMQIEGSKVLQSQGALFNFLGNLPGALGGFL